MSRMCSLFDELRAYKRSRALTVAITGGLLDAISDDGGTSDKVAADCGMSEDWACSLLGVLADLELVECVKDNWRLTSAGRDAATDKALRSFASYHLHCYEAWKDLPERTGGVSSNGGFHRQSIGNPVFARAYLQSMEAIGQRSLPFLQKECHLDGNVVDVGAGPSTFCRHLAATPECRVTGLDLPPLVESAKQLFRYPDPFEWVAADFREYAPEDRFDGLFCSHLLEYASPSELPGWLAQLRGFLRPGGTAAFLVFLRESREDRVIELDLFELSTGLNGERLGRICTLDEFRAVLNDAGAKNIMLKALPKGPSYSEYLVTCLWA